MSVNIGVSDYLCEQIAIV